MAQVAVLARLLLPEDYGLMAVVGAFLGFSALFSDLGINGAFMQRQEVSDDERSSIFWFNCLLAIAVTIAVILVSPLLAEIFGEQRIAPLLILGSFTILIGAIASQVKVAVQKELDFRLLVATEAASNFFGFLSSVVGALLGWGVYALVAGSLVAAATSSILAWVYLSGGWRPKLHMRAEEIGKFIGFGSALVGHNIANYFITNCDIFIGGRSFSANQLGLYSVPRNLCLQVQFTVNSIVTSIGFPLIAKVQSDLTKVRSIYLKTLNMTASTNAPIYIGIAFFAPEITFALLGEGWSRSGDILGILALWGGVRSTFNPLGSLLLGLGRSDLSLKWALVVLVLVPASVWLGAQFGASGMALSLMLIFTFLYFPAWYFLVRPLCGASWTDYCLSSLIPFLLALIATLPAAFISSYIESALLTLLVALIVSAPIYLGLCYFFNKAWCLAMLDLLGKKNLPI